eukprot:IDg7636t1
MRDKRLEVEVVFDALDSDETSHAYQAVIADDAVNEEPDRGKTHPDGEGITYSSHEGARAKELLYVLSVAGLSNAAL